MNNELQAGNIFRLVRLVEAAPGHVISTRFVSEPPTRSLRQAHEFFGIVRFWSMFDERPIQRL